MFMAHFCAILVYKKRQINILLLIEDILLRYSNIEYCIYLLFQKAGDNNIYL